MLTYTGINDLDEYQYVLEKSRNKSGTFHDMMSERSKEFSFGLGGNYAYWGPKDNQGKPDGFWHQGRSDQNNKIVESSTAS